VCVCVCVCVCIFMVPADPGCAGKRPLNGCSGDSGGRLFVSHHTMTVLLPLRVETVLATWHIFTSLKGVTFLVNSRVFLYRLKMLCQ